MHKVNGVENIHLLRGYWLLALLPLFALTWALYQRKYFSRSWRAICDPRLLPHILVGQGDVKRRLWPYICFATVGCLIIIALSGPVFKKLPQPVFRSQQSLVIVFDLSASMDSIDSKPSRVVRARHKIIDILEKRKEGQTALVVYALEPFVVSPLTEDSKTIISLVSSLNTGLMPNQGSKPGNALEKAVDLMKQAGVNNGHILLVTDGLDDTTVDNQIEKLVAMGHRLSILGVGTADGAPIRLADGRYLKDRQGSIVIPKLDVNRLSQLAALGNGRFKIISNKDSDIDYLLNTMNENNRFDIQSQETQSMQLKTDQWREEGPWILLLVLPLVALVFRRGWIAILLIVWLPFPGPSHAFEWQDLWKNSDQKAAKAFANGNNEQAVKLFKNQQWKAAAQFRNKDYQGVVETLKDANTADALYNKANAMAKLGKFEDAIASYDQALTMAPDNKDAEYNRELVKKQMQEQQNNQQSKKDQKGQDGQQDKKSEQDADSGEQNQGDQQQQAQSEDGQKSDQGEEKQQQSEQGAQANKEDQAEQNKESEAAAAEQSQEEDKNSDDEQHLSKLADSTDVTSEEMKQAKEQWLRRIPDDPGGLLRRKFRYQSRLNRQRRPTGVQAW